MIDSPQPSASYSLDVERVQGKAYGFEAANAEPFPFDQSANAAAGEEAEVGPVQDPPLVVVERSEE